MVWFWGMDSMRTSRWRCWRPSEGHGITVIDDVRGKRAGGDFQAGSPELGIAVGTAAQTFEVFVVVTFGKRRSMAEVDPGPPGDGGIDASPA